MYIQVRQEVERHNMNKTKVDVIIPTYHPKERFLALMEQLDAFWMEQGFGAAELRLTSDLFSTLPTDALQYALYHAGYTDELEIAA